MTTEQERLSVDASLKGAFRRKVTRFHSLITCDGRNNTLRAECNRYHLYLTPSCPWCHRVLIVIALKGLQDCISITFTSPILRNTHNRMKKGLKASEEYIGWEFNEEYPDSLYPKAKSVWDIYKIHDRNYSNYDRLTVPILFDKKTKKIVNNESAELIEILNNEFNEFAKYPLLNLSPKDNKIQSMIRKWNDEIYANLNDGVYRAGFAATQQAFDDAVNGIFYILDKMEKHLSKNRYLCGNIFTLSDIRAFPTLIRFDTVYYMVFKCNLKPLRDYKNVWGYTREIYQMNGIKETVDMESIKQLYYNAHRSIRQTTVVIPKGPLLNLDEPHNRDKLKAKL